ncbi:MAG: nucleotide exchange factor GrpE [Bacteroidia bacterium]|nr:nucleotide exchange factor GrpE [Bacteroidia bacterium]
MSKGKKQNNSREIPVQDPVDVKDIEMENEEMEEENPAHENGQNGPNEPEMEGEIKVEDDGELIRLKQEVGELKDKHIRLIAEFDNFRKRTQKEKLSLISTANEDLMKALLPVLGDFSRTMEAIEKTDNLASIREGVKLVSHNLNHILEKKGLSKLESKAGDVFNSEIHEAITTVPAGEDKVGKIVDVIEPGFKLNDKVIRYAKVVVGE